MMRILRPAPVHNPGAVDFTPFQKNFRFIFKFSSFSAFPRRCDVSERMFFFIPPLPRRARRRAPQRLSRCMFENQQVLFFTNFVISFFLGTPSFPSVSSGRRADLAVS